MRNAGSRRQVRNTSILQAVQRKPFLFRSMRPLHDTSTLRFYTQLPIYIRVSVRGQACAHVSDKRGGYNRNGTERCIPRGGIRYPDASSVVMTSNAAGWAWHLGKSTFGSCFLGAGWSGAIYLKWLPGMPQGSGKDRSAPGALAMPTS